jgi:tetratricopeptide (TPR) repeat protein
MALFRKHTLSLDLNNDTLSFFFPEAGNAKNHDAIADRVRSTFNNLNGVIETLTIGATKIEMHWNDDLSKSDNLDKIAAILTQGNYLDGILLLELFLSEDPDNPDLLYNLGMAYSDQNKLSHSIALLTRLMSVKPDHVNGRVALGIALVRNNQEEEGVRELQTAAQKEPENLWAHRNLGGGLMRLKRFPEAAEHLRIATELSPQDQQVWYGYAQALEALDNIEAADKAYIQTIEIDGFSKIADLARKARSNIAKGTFRKNAPGALRMDAVMYCVGALEMFEAMSVAQVQKIGFEIAMLGTRGIDVNNPESRYSLKSLPGEFSGLHLLSIQYVAFKKIAPTQDIGFDLSVEYQAALKLFEK